MSVEDKVSKKSSVIKLREKALRSVNTKLYHANELNSATLGLSRDQMRILQMCKKRLASGSWPENGIFAFSRQEYGAYFSIGDAEAGRDLKRAINSFRGAVIQLRSEIDGVIMEGEIDWTTSRWKCDERGQYALKLNSDLIPFLMPGAYEKLMTITNFDHARRLNSKWAILLYELLCQFRETGRFYIRLDDLRQRWATPASYEKWSLFKSRILEPSVSEVRNLPDFGLLTYTLKKGENGDVLFFHFDSHSIA